MASAVQIPVSPAVLKWARYLRRAFRLRPLFVPKNRFGPAVLDPLVLTMNDSGRLSKAPHTTAQSSVVFGWSGVGENLTEAQAVVSLPRYGSNPELNAPNLPRARVKHLMNTISQLKDVDVTNLSYTSALGSVGRSAKASS